MARSGRREGGRKKRRQSGKEFMDAAIDGYIRDLALRMFREIEDLDEAYGHDSERVLREAGAALAHKPYGELWKAAWEHHVWPSPQAPEQSLFGRIEGAVREALLAMSPSRTRRTTRSSWPGR